MNQHSIIRLGNWILPKSDDIGYLDQHYATLSPDKTVMETIRCLWPYHADADIRKHLNDFLFRKNEEVTALVSSLSGGEKARLSLAQIAAKPPKLLILDESTNALDQANIIKIQQALSQLHGKMTILIISHQKEMCDFADQHIELTLQGMNHVVRNQYKTGGLVDASRAQSDQAAIV